METRIKRTQRDYTLGFKLAVVEQVEKGQMTYKQAQRHYGIQGRSTVLGWLRKHGKLDWQRQRSSDFEGAPMSGGNGQIETPEQRIKALEVQLKEAKEKAALFEAIVDVLREDYGITVAKKRSGKSSRKNVSKT